MKEKEFKKKADELIRKNNLLKNYYYGLDENDDVILDEEGMRDELEILCYKLNEILQSEYKVRKRD